MASARKKQDEKNLKLLRELVSLPGNKHCFDCNQRGPTYVNMTIGSFVCTKCSGMLRGLTPPHRVKSISMASFTSEEVDFIKSRGNNVCRQTWLALYDQTCNSDTKDEQQTKDFMIDKYERKRFYHDKGLTNCTNSKTVTQKTSALPEAKPLATLLGNQTSNLQIKTNFNNGSMNGNSTLSSSDSGSDFVADFTTADIFSASHFNNNNNNNNNNSSTVQTTQPSFANFDNNVIFNSATYQSSYDLLMSQLSQMPRYFPNKWNVTLSTPLTTINTLSNSTMNKLSTPPSEDRYAALKDLDNALKNHQESQLEWNTPSSNGSGYASPSQNSSLYGSPSTAGSFFGSPSQGTFGALFPQSDMPSNISNPFSTSNIRNPWGSSGNSTVVANNFQSFGANPFRTDNFNGVIKYNGTTNGYNSSQMANPSSFQQNIFTSSQNANFTTKPWTSPNPFTLGVTPSNASTSNNPFL